VTQLALALDPADELDLEHAAEVLAAETPPGREAERCRCDPRPKLAGLDDDGDPVCLHCARRLP
jgi:hypothetical protein